MSESSKDISGLGLEELKALLVQALERVARLEKENAELRAEIARLKGLKGRPKLKPSGMEQATQEPEAPDGRAAAAPSGQSSPSTRPATSSRTACRKAPGSRAMRISSS